MSKPEEQRLTEDKPQLVQPDNNEESSSGESDEQPGTSRAVAMQAGMSHDAGNQVLQTMENAEASQSALSRIDPGWNELTSKLAESGVGTVMINYAPKIYHHDERQYQHHDQRRYQDNREYKQKYIRDLKNIKPTQVKEKQINPLDSAKRFEPSIEQQDPVNNPFDPPQSNTQTQDPPDVTHPKQPIEANPQVEPHTDISEVTNQSNALNTEIPSTTFGNVDKQPTICRGEKKTSGVLYQTGFTQPKQPISASTSQTEVPSTSPLIANPPTTSFAEPNNPQATNSPCGPGAHQHQDDNKGNQHIMISYNWKDSKDPAHKISDELSAAGYKVWIDKNEMRGDIYDQMYEAVDNAYLVLMFLSENYKLSENCRREGKLAADKRKRIIPIITQDNYKMEGWTALLVSGKLYYDFSKESFEDNFDKLVKEIDHPNEQQQFTKCLEANKADHRKLGKREKAIGKVLQQQNERREDDIRLQAGIDVSVADIPIVHPKYTKLSFFQGRAVRKHETYAPSTGEPDTLKRDEDIEFEELLKSNNRFTAFIGYPGSGKTTLSKRLAKTEEYKCLYYKFMEMPVGEKVSFRKLIMDNIYPDLDETTREDAWEWIKENQKSCLLLFDGLDQAEWSLKDKVPKVNYDTPQSVPDLIANLCNKHFLPDIKLIFTSRPHSVITLPAPLRPDSTILLGDLPLDSMNKLFYFYAGASADKLWNDFSRNAKIVFALCFNPLLLQLVIAAGLAPTTKIGKIITTTRVFATVLENLRCSDNAHHKDITSLVKQLSEVAYKTTMRSSVVITRDDLRAVGLEPDQIQDIVVGIYAHFAAVSRVFDGHVKYYFAHQLYQEFFTAKFIVNELPMDAFKHLVSNKLFSNEKWSVIRRFVCGLLIDMMKDSSMSNIAATGHDQRERSLLLSRCFCCLNRQDDQVEEQISLTQKPAEEKISSPEHQSSALLSHRSTEQQEYMKASSSSDIAEKRRIWIETLKSQLVHFEKLHWNEWSEDRNNRRRYISLLCELNESSDMELFNMASQRFPTEMDLYGLKLSSSEAAIFCDVLRKQRKELKLLGLISCFSPDDVERLISAISEMPEKVKVLSIGGNIIKDIPGPEFFAKIEDGLFMGNCFEDERFSANSSEKQKIQLVLDQLHDSRLRVNVGYDDDYEDVILTPRKHC
ncbi:unnamed protein product [Clavelina lepadiformis]|uniref:TIR domain-containing protein n=1 Tax=Clavelina lepadiformis TaxID=159417 RepID=A0ABP0G9K9_CLALP